MIAVAAKPVQALSASCPASALLGRAPSGPAVIRNVASGFLAVIVTYGVGSFARACRWLTIRRDHVFPGEEA